MQILISPAESKISFKDIKDAFFKHAVRLFFVMWAIHTWAFSFAVRYVFLPFAFYFSLEFFSFYQQKKTFLSLFFAILLFFKNKFPLMQNHQKFWARSRENFKKSKISAEKKNLFHKIFSLSKFKPVQANK